MTFSSFGGARDKTTGKVEGKGENVGFDVGVGAQTNCWALSSESVAPKVMTSLISTQNSLVLAHVTVMPGSRFLIAANVPTLRCNQSGLSNSRILQTTQADTLRAEG